MYKLDKFVNDISIGLLNINKITFINICLDICNKENTNLLHIYSNIKDKIENNVLNYIKNDNNIYNEIVLKINEWGLNITPNDIFDINVKLFDIDNYEKFMYLNTQYNDLKKNNNNTDKVNKLKDNLLLYLKKYNHNIVNIEPNYNYLLIDLSNIKYKNINNIFINYILLINFIKKEIHYIKGIMESIIQNI